MLTEDNGNFCPMCDMIIHTDDLFEPACNCISKIESWSEEEIDDQSETLPSHIRSYFRPEKPKGAT